MSKEEILKTLNGKNGPDSRTLLEFCKTPKTGGELMKCRTKKDAFETIVILKNTAAIAFQDGKYFTTQLGLDILDSLPK